MAVEEASWRFSGALTVDGAPASAAARQQRVRLAWSRASGWIDRQLSCVLPGVEHRLHDAPCVLHDIGAHEQRLIADHDIVEQGLVSDIGLLGKPVLVAEV